MPISDFQSQFSASQIIRIFVNFLVVDIFWKLQILKHFKTDVDLTKKNSWKSASYHSIKLPFDAEVAEKILNYICILYT